MRIFLIAALIACPVSASAQSGPFDMGRVQQGASQLVAMAANVAFDQADLNKDGYVTREEARKSGMNFGGLQAGSQDKAWALIDRNQDGVIDRGELIAAVVLMQARTAAGQKPF